MNKKYFFLLGVGVLLCVGGYFVWADEPMVVVNPAIEQATANKEIMGTRTESRVSPKTTNKNTAQKTTITSKNMYVVTYTKDGFEPSEIQIPRGTTIKFVNKTGTSMRIFASASSTPPFSDLNQPKTLGLNGEYEFNFVYSGIWEYYNSLKPEDIGKVVVY